MALGRSQGVGPVANRHAGGRDRIERALQADEETILSWDEVIRHESRADTGHDPTTGEKGKGSR